MYGFDRGKLVKGRKRHLVVDTLGLVLGVVVTEANTQDRIGAAIRVASSLRLIALLEQVCASENLELIWVDAGDRGERFAQVIDGICAAKSEVRNQKSEVRSRKSEVGSRK